MLVLIGGHPKGFSEAFHEKTKSGKILRKMIGEPVDGVFCFFDLWKNQEEQESGVLNEMVLCDIRKFLKKKYTLIALGRFTEKALVANNIKCLYLPHPASRRGKDLSKLKDSLQKLLHNH